MEALYKYKTKTRLWDLIIETQDDSFKFIFMDDSLWIVIQVLLKFVPNVSINNKPALVQKWLGADQTTSHYLNPWLFILYARIALDGLRSNGITIWIV